MHFLVCIYVHVRRCTTWSSSNLIFPTGLAGGHTNVASLATATYYQPTEQHSPAKYPENGHDTLSDFVTFVCQEAENAQNQVCSINFFLFSPKTSAVIQRVVWGSYHFLHLRAENYWTAVVVASFILLSRLRKWAIDRN